MSAAPTTPSPSPKRTGSVSGTGETTGGGKGEGEGGGIGGGDGEPAPFFFFFFFLDSALTSLLGWTEVLETTELRCALSLRELGVSEGARESVKEEEEGGVPSEGDVPVWPPLGGLCPSSDDRVLMVTCSSPGRG